MWTCVPRSISGKQETLKTSMTSPRTSIDSFPTMKCSCPKGGMGRYWVYHSESDYSATFMSMKTATNFTFVITAHIIYVNENGWSYIAGLTASLTTPFWSLSEWVMYSTLPVITFCTNYDIDFTTDVSMHRSCHRLDNPDYCEHDSWRPTSKILEKGSEKKVVL